jgi:hypothetical protein
MELDNFADITNFANRVTETVLATFRLLLQVAVEEMLFRETPA